MKRFKHSTIALTLSTLMLGAVGCNGDSSTSESSNPTAGHAEGDGHGHDDGNGHDHDAHGPHGGDLIELGGDDFHAEIVHSDNDEIIIYLLESDAKTALPIDATEVIINAVHKGTPEQFKLSSSADEGDPEGKSSRFTSSDAELLEHVHDADAQAKLVVEIDGKPYSGKIAHDHDADHGHSH